MALEVNIHEAKTHLSKLLNRVIAGEEIIIAKSGVPIAYLSAIKPKLAKRVPGTAKGKIKVSANFNSPLPENLIRAFEGKR